MLKRILFLTLISGLLVGLVPAATAQDNTVTLITHDSFSISEETLAAFEDETGITVEILLAGDAGTMVNQAILTKNNPQADLMFGVDNTFLGRALDNDLFAPYESPILENVPEEFILDEEHRVTPIDYGDVCLNYDISYFEENGLPLPTSLQDLTDPVYEGLLVVENPAVSSPGLAFLLATIAQFGEDGYLDYWADLVDNDVLVVNDWTTAYYGDFTIAGGDRPLVVSYASSPPAEVIYADPPVDTAPTGSIIADGTCFRQIEFAGILDGADNPEDAQKLIDFMLGETFQNDVPLQMFVFPVNPDATLPPEFIDYAQLSENPASLAPDVIEAGRDEWIQAWTETVLR